MPYRRRKRKRLDLGAAVKALEVDIARKKALLKSARLLAKILYVAARAPSIPVPRQRRRRRRRKAKPEVPVPELVPKRRRGRPPKAKPPEAVIPATA